MTRGNFQRAWQSVNPERLGTVLRDLIDIYSPAGKEEDVQLYLEDLLTKDGCIPERQEVEEGRYNLRVALTDAEPALYFVGHVDTVTAWDLEDYGPHLEGDIVRGLGSADMKGGCAAMIEAWRVLLELPADERPNVGLLLVVGEEESGDGSQTFLKDRQPEWVVIGEPTGLSACFAHYGYMEVGFTTLGRRIHSSLPELGHNAVESMLRLLLHWENEPLFQRAESGLVYSIRELSSSRAGFVVPDRCEAWIDCHLPPGSAPRQLERDIREFAEKASGLVPDLTLDLFFDYSAPGYDLGIENPPADLIRGIYAELALPLRFDAFRSHSDGNLFREAGSYPLILGPGFLETAHTHEEQTTMSQVTSAAKIYIALALGMG